MYNLFWVYLAEVEKETKPSVPNSIWDMITYRVKIVFSQQLKAKLVKGHNI